jgi:hypothetical protein
MMVKNQLLRNFLKNNFKERPNLLGLSTKQSTIVINIKNNEN